MATFTPSKTTVIRVEREGYGPYSEGRISTDGEYWEYPWHVGTGCPCDPIQHPTWMHDHFLPSIKQLGVGWDGYVFGFLNVEQYIAWFSTPAARHSLSQAGFFINIYQSKRVYESPRQCLFTPDRVLNRNGFTPSGYDLSPRWVADIGDIQYANAA